MSERRKTNGRGVEEDEGDEKEPESNIMRIEEVRNRHDKDVSLSEIYSVPRIANMARTMELMQCRYGSGKRMGLLYD